MLGSSVLPDLLETMKSVFARSTFFSTLLICAGSVESSMCRRGKPGVCPKVSANTSGQRLDPPMPSSKMSENAPLLTSSANFFSLAALASCSSAMPSHPNQLASSSPVQREASRCQSRLTFPDARQSLRFFFYRRIEFGRKGCALGIDLGRTRPFGILLDRGQQCVEGVGKQFHAIGR